MAHQIDHPFPSMQGGSTMPSLDTLSSVAGAASNVAGIAGTLGKASKVAGAAGKAAGAINPVGLAMMGLDMGIKGFRQDLIENGIETIKHEISMLVSSYRFQTKVSPIEDYKDSSEWLSFC